MSGRELILIGAGGHAKVIAAAIAACGDQLVAVFDDDVKRHGTTLLGAPIVGPVAAAREHAVKRAVLGIGSNAARARLGSELGLEWASVVHPRTWVHETVNIGAGSVVFAGAIIQPDAVLGEHVIVNTSASIDHDCVLGRAVHVAPGVHLAGGVRIGEQSFLGVGASAIPYVTIGARTTIGAGGVVVKDIESDVTAVGVPARVLRRT